MNKLLLSLLLVLSFNKLSAQITIDSSDVAVAGDTVLYSEASPLTAGIDLTLTGANYSWDFSTLTPVSQTADTMRDIASFGNLYSLFFINIGFNPNRASAALRGSFPAIPGLTLSDVYNFYYKSDTTYSQVGVGATLNGADVPVGYSVRDVVYNFPMNYQDQDTSNSDFNVSIPNLGSYYAAQTRISNVDGWGTVITPYGSFNCLRTVNVLTGHDSVHVDSLGLGLGFDRTLTREYKWLAKGEDGPVLQINTQELLPGNETISSIKYRDSVQVVSGVAAIGGNDELVVYPNPATDNIRIKYNSKFDGSKTIQLRSADGRLIYDDHFSSTKNLVNINIETQDLSSGIYLLSINDGNHIINRKIIISR